MRIHSFFVKRHAYGPLGVLSRLMPLAALVACDTSVFSPSAPIIDSRWVVPSQTTRIAVGSFLPAGVAILSDSSGFAVAVPNTNTTRALGTDCAQCLAANGLVAAKPAFIALANMSTSIPVDVASATITGGTLQIVVTNNYTFDPLRPNPGVAGGATGTAVITVSNGATSLGTATVDGATTALPANGGTLNISVPLAGTMSGSSPVTVGVSLTSPVGIPVLIDASKTIVVSATLPNLKVASANVNVVNKQVSSTSTLDLLSVDQTISDHVLSGSLLLTVTNPFAVTGSLTVTLTPAGGAPVTKSIALVLGNSTPSVTFTKAELQRLLGHSVTLTLSGGTNAASGTVNISPKQAVVVTSRLDISIEVGG
jgi:hypothetical protein